MVLFVSVYSVIKNKKKVKEFFKKVLLCIIMRIAFKGVFKSMFLKEGYGTYLLKIKLSRTIIGQIKQSPAFKGWA